MSKQTELMEFTTQELTEIVERSSTLEERLGNGFVGDADYSSDRAIQMRLDRWCDVAARGDAATFAKRLAWDNLSLETLHPILGSVKLHHPLPSWTNTLNAVMRSLSIVPAQSEVADRCLHPESLIAFQEVFIPVVQVARQQLIQQTGKLHTLLSDNAHAGLEHSLLTRLSQLCFQTFELEFKLFQMQHQSKLDQLLNCLNAQPSQVQYQTFVQQLLTGRLRSLLQEYSVLARLMATFVDFWVNATTEMIRHLSEDWTAIAQTFQPENELGQVIGIRPFLSDSHHNGRTVVGLRFSSGLTLIYKPRSLALDVAYYDLLDRLNQQGAIAAEGDPADCLKQLPFKTLNILDRSTHGWVEYVPYTPCQTEAEIQRYYVRSGMLLALIYALRGTDFHLENLIAAGDQPVPVDLEMLMHPPFRYPEMPQLSKTQYLDWKSREDSVLSTMLLPFVLVVDGQHYDISALGAALSQELQLPTLKAVNTDQMGLVQEKLQPVPRSISPFAVGSTDSMHAYVEDIVAGFEQMYRCLQVQKANLLKPDGCLTQFQQQQGRYLHRNTRIYVMVIQRALRPQFLRDGVDFSIELDHFCRPLLRFDEKPDIWAILAAERSAMAQLDIPHLKLDSSSSDLILNYPQRLPHFFAQSGYAGMLARIQSLSPADLTQQIDLIRHAVSASHLDHSVGKEPEVTFTE
ncbi:MAG: type 2 lanthipeptide synthetase LanM [Nostoc sp.]|uniref:type 2 lanthipeptide synthetase LanM n=1 Tax=Nostoc sp. TaxID=1180 RepID=UPI002FFC1DBF